MTVESTQRRKKNRKCMVVIFMKSFNAFECDGNVEKGKAKKRKPFKYLECKNKHREKKTITL